MAEPTTYRGFTIRQRHRRGYLREAGGHAVWDEVQVVGEGGRVLGRFDFDHQARAWIDRTLGPEA
jgi:hypothetical protein